MKPPLDMKDVDTPRLGAQLGGLHLNPLSGATARGDGELKDRVT